MEALRLGNRKMLQQMRGDADDDDESEEEDPDNKPDEDDQSTGDVITRRQAALADQLEKMSATGVAGTTLAFVDYAREFPYFRQEVLPRLEARGLRAPV